MMGSAPVSELAINTDIVSSLVNITDAAIITIGRNSGEGYDRNEGEGDFLLTTSEKELIKSVTEAYHSKGKKTIVILNVGGVIETASWKDIPDAILLAWQAGQETGNSIADILVGKVNPSGKLASTFPANYKDVPSAGNFPGKVTGQTQPNPDREGGIMASFMSPQPAEVTYEEGIYAGYRYYTTFNVAVSYEFGFGLSYSTFEYSNIKLSSAKFGKNITATVEIRNSGKAEGKEIVQLYLTAPGKTLDKPVMELKGFKKTGLLKPGDSQVLSFEISKMDLSSFDPVSSSWIAEKGTYTVKIGASSKEIRQTATFVLGKDLIVKEESSALIPKTKINELKPR
jgi:beta-glucosidase